MCFTAARKPRTYLTCFIEASEARTAVCFVETSKGRKSRRAEHFSE